MESCSLGNLRSSLQTQRHIFITWCCHNQCYSVFRKSINIFGLTCVLKEEQCWMILCSSSWTSSTQRRLGSSSRLICRFTNNSKDTSGTKSAGRGPCRANHTHQLYYLPAILSNERTWQEFELNKLHKQKSGEAHRSVADGSEDIKLSQSSQRVDGLQSAAKGLVEYVTDPSAATAVEEKVSAVTPMLFLSAVCQQC